MARRFWLLISKTLQIQFVPIRIKPLDIEYLSQMQTISDIH